MPSPRCVVDFLNDVSSNSPKLGHIDALTGSEKEVLFYQKVPSFAFGSQLHQLHCISMVLHAILDYILNVTVGCSDGTEIGFPT